MSEAIETARRYLDLYRRKRQLETELKDIEQKIKGDDTTKGVQAQLVEAFLADGLTQIKVDGSMVFLSTTIRASRKSDVEESVFIETMRDAGYGDLIRETINANSLSGALRDEIKTARNNDPSIPVDQIVSPAVLGVTNIYEIPEPRVRL